MAPAKSEFIADLLLYVLNNEPNLQLYFGIISTTVKKAEAKGELDKTFTREILDPSYVRQPISFTKPKDDFVKLVESIQFARTTQKWEKITHFGVFDAKIGGNMLLLKPTGTVITVEIGEIVTIQSDEFYLYTGHNTHIIP